MTSPDQPVGPTLTMRPGEGWADLRASLHRYALVLTRNLHDADDLTQHTIERLLTVQHPIVDPRAFAIRVATRLWLDSQRSTRRTLARLLRLPTRVNASSNPAHDAEARAAIDAALSRLPPMQRATLVLRLVEGLDYPAIALVLGIQVGAVRANLHLARAAMRAALGSVVDQGAPP